MGEPDWRRIKEIFSRVADVPEDQRGPLLDAACGSDAELRGHVEALLGSHSKAGEFMGAPTLSGGGDTSPTERPGDQIGPYTLASIIGEGGFGVVYAAEQSEPLRRRVALKVIKLGMDTRQVIARFEQERQALSVMDHPSIARVLDAGVTARGQPYFVMELIEGLSITRYCDTNLLSPRQRLELFIPVCQAVQHAHQKGIIHRDLKPGNVLVAMQDGRPVPKIIDFGIAKATAQGVSEHTAITDQRHFLGTPEYMSPEQADPGARDIDTRSDVYSLGVLLYELLAGATPFDPRSLRAAGYAEIQRIIREDEPPKPSTRLSTLDTLASVAACRKVEPTRLGKLVRGDLDWIVMKCLEKDRGRRYETASGLAADIERHLAGDAVVAAPPSRGYRLRKFVRRNRGPVVATLLVAASLVAGIIGTGFEMFRAERQRNLVEVQRNEAEKAADFMGEMLTSFYPNREGDAAAMVRIVDLASAKIEEGALRDAPEAEIRLRTSLGGEYRLIAKYESAEKMLNAALKLARAKWLGDRAETADILDELGTLYFDQARFAEAEPLLVQALDMRRRLFKGDHSAVAQGLNQLSIVRRAVGRNAEAEALCIESSDMARRLNPNGSDGLAATLSNLAMTRMDLGRGAESEAPLEEALRIKERLHPGDDRDKAQMLVNLAHLRRGLRHPELAEPMLERALHMFERLYPGDHPQTASALSELGMVRLELGHATDAEPLVIRAYEMQGRLVPGDSFEMAGILGDRGLLRQVRGDPAGAEALTRENLEMVRRLFGPDHALVVGALQGIGWLRSAQGDPASAEVMYRQSLEVAQRVFPEGHPAITSIMAGLSRALSDLAWADRDSADADRGLKKAREAEALIRQALSQKKYLGPGDTGMVYYRGLLGCALVSAAACDRSAAAGDLGKALREAEPMLSEAFETVTKEAEEPAPHFPGWAMYQVKPAAERLVRLFTLWDQIEPGQGYDAKAAEWKAKFDALPAIAVFGGK